MVRMASQKASRTACCLPSEKRPIGSWTGIFVRAADGMGCRFDTKMYFLCVWSFVQSSFRFGGSSSSRFKWNMSLRLHWNIPSSFWHNSMHSIFRVIFSILHCAYVDYIFRGDDRRTHAPSTVFCIFRVDYRCLFLKIFLTYYALHFYPKAKENSDNPIYV